MADTLIEQRLTAVEKMIRERQHPRANPPPAANWIEQITGSFKDEPAFAEVLEFGRAIRSTDQPAEETGESVEVPAGH